MALSLPGSGEDRRPLLMGVAAVVVVGLLGYLLMGYWDQLSQRETAARKQLADLQTAVQDTSTAGGAMRVLRERATVYTERVQLNQQTPQMLQQVQRLPGYADMSVRRLEGLPVRDEEDYYRSAVSLQFRGNLGSVTRFLNEVEKAQPTLKVERLNISAENKESGTIEGQMVIAAYAVVLDGPRRKDRNRRG